MMAGLLVILALYAAVFGLAETVYRRGVEAWITRKITHIGGGVVSATLPLFVDLPTTLGLGLFFSSDWFGPNKPDCCQASTRLTTGSSGRFCFRSA
jgi:hypothetical protein